MVRAEDALSNTQGLLRDGDALFVTTIAVQLGELLIEAVPLLMLRDKRDGENGKRE